MGRAWTKIGGQLWPSQGRDLAKERVLAEGLKQTNNCVLVQQPQRW